jgi:dihydrofolate reductase
MGAIHVHEFMSLDGVIDAPTWTASYGFDPRMGEAIGAVTSRAHGILLGRATYEMFEGPWSTRTAEDDPGAPFFNDTNKYVVSSTLSNPSWRNSRVIGPYQPEVMHLFMFPHSRGEGPRLFPDQSRPANWSLARCEPYSNGVVYLNYRYAP